jgi:PilZ domain
LLCKASDVPGILHSRAVFKYQVFSGDSDTRLNFSLERKERLIPRKRDCSMTYGDRKSERVNFDHGIPVYMMGIDGTWRRECTMIDVSQTGARLHIEGSLEGLDLKEFFLLLSSTGLAYRRCQLVRVAGDQIGIEFLARERKPKRK